MKVLKIVVGAVIFISAYVQAKKPIVFVDGTHARGIFGDKISLRFNQEPIINYLPSVNDYIEAEDNGIKMGESLPFANDYMEIEDEGVQVTELVQNSFKELTFFLPLVTIKNDKVRRFIEHINNIDGKTYYVAFEQTKEPMQGLKCTVAFNPKDVGFRLELFVSPKQEHGVSLMFFNRNQLGTIATHHDTIKRMAYIKPDFQKKKYA